MKNIPAKLLLLVTILVAFLVIDSDRDQAAQKTLQDQEQRSFEGRRNAGQISLPKYRADAELPATQLVLPIHERLMTLASVSMQQ